LPARVKLPRHGCEARHTNLERIGHFRELCLVRKVGLEEMLGLGNASDIRSSRVGRMRNLSLRRRPGRAGQGNEWLNFRTRRRRNGRQGRLDVSVGGGR
jgi:hypothetical protein